METIREMTEEKFQEIYTSESLRNDVAYAHIHCDEHGKYKYRATCSYPVKWIVTDKQIETAKIELARRKAEVFANHSTDLLFVGMGMTYSEEYPDDVCNYRIRTEFLNKEGGQFFVELGTGIKPDSMRCDYAIDRDTQKREGDQSGYNFMGLERRPMLPKYTKQNVLDLVNSMFNCAFKNIVIDNYNIGCDDREIICTSPAK